jgi:hypothetical protein
MAKKNKCYGCRIISRHLPRISRPIYIHRCAQIDKEKNNQEKMSGMSCQTGKAVCVLDRAATQQAGRVLQQPNFDVRQVECVAACG